jgi:hypothetical protein
VCIYSCSSLIWTRGNYVKTQQTTCARFNILFYISAWTIYTQRWITQLSMISSSCLVLFDKPSIVLCWLDRRICSLVMMFYISVIDVVIAVDIVWGIVNSRFCCNASVIIGTNLCIQIINVVKRQRNLGLLYWQTK